jgi:hypothetical protein
VFAVRHRKRRRRKHVPLKSKTALSQGGQLRVALLALREEMLHDFLVAAGSEAPGFRDNRTIEVAPRVAIGPTIATIDFLGDAVVRTHLRNDSPHSISGLIVLRAQSDGGAILERSVVIEHLPSDGTRMLEFSALHGHALRALSWRFTPLE